MNTKTALRIRKFIPKKRIAKIERLIIAYGDIVESFEEGTIDFEQARDKSTTLFKQAIQDKLIAPSNVQEIMEVDKETVQHLREKHGV